jgi:hypothetical protein
VAVLLGHKNEGRESDPGKEGRQSLMVQDYVGLVKSTVGLQEEGGQVVVFLLLFLACVCFMGTAMHLTTIHSRGSCMSSGPDLGMKLLTQEKKSGPCPQPQRGGDLMRGCVSTVVLMPALVALHPQIVQKPSRGTPSQDVSKWPRLERTKIK